MGIPLLDARAAQRGIPLLDAETRHQRWIPLLDAKTQWNMHGQQDVRGISHWFCDAKTCCWLYTGFFGAKIVKSASGCGQFTIIHYNCFFNAASTWRRRTKSSLGRRTRKGAMQQAHQRRSADQQWKTSSERRSAVKNRRNQVRCHMMICSCLFPSGAARASSRGIPSGAWVWHLVIV